jgi:hypothetical protein
VAGNAPAWDVQPSYVMAITAYADANSVISKHLEDGTIPTAAERSASTTQG